MSLDKRQLRKHRWRNRLRSWPKIVVVLIILGFIGLEVVDYFANLPRERFAKNFSYTERAVHGAKAALRMSALSLEAHHEDLDNSKLPLAEIFIKGKRLDRLKQGLPYNERKKKAKVRIGDEVYKADVKFRGDSMNHWAFPNRSWRVKLDDGDFFRGMQSFNLIVPRVESQMSNWLGYKMGERAGLTLSPFADMVHFRLNRQFDGVRLLLEQPSIDFLLRRHLPPGKIFDGDITSEQIYGEIPRKRLYSQTDAWQVDSPTDDISRNEMAALLEILREQHNPFDFYRQMHSIMDMEQLTRYMALLELVGSVHVDDTHNGKFYFHPHKGKFIPILWDTVAYFWGNSKPLDLGSNRLFRVVLANPEFRAAKDAALWEFVTGDLSTERLHTLVRQQYEKLKSDMYATPLKVHANDKGVRHVSNAEWDEAVEKLLSSIQERNERITKRVGATDVQYNLSRQPDGRHLLGVQVASPTGFLLEKIQIAGGDDFTLSRRGVEDVAEVLSVKAEPLRSERSQGDLSVFQMSDRLFSKRRFAGKSRGEIVPATYVYEISGPDSLTLDDVSLVGRNAISHLEAKAKPNAALKIAKQHRENIVWWQPDDFEGIKTVTWSGSVSIPETIRFPKNARLVVEAGATVRAAPGASIFIDGGSLEVRGTAERPIRFLPSEDGSRWGVLAVRNSKSVLLEHFEIRDTSYAHLSEVRFDGGLALNGSEGAIRNGRLVNSYISARSSRIDVENISARSIFPFVVQSENSVVKEKDTNVEQMPQVHSVSLLEKEGHGTQARTEREFKYSIVGAAAEQSDLLDVADYLREAIEASNSRPDVWEAPKYTKNQYYVDDEVEDFLFRDIYFDTAESLNYKKAVSHRFRNRYRSWDDYKLHLKHPDWPEMWPYRLEFQAKAGREELQKGFSTVEEARFEFRDESEPFSPESPAPRAPWPIDEFLPYFQTGEYRGLATFPGQMIVEVHKEDIPESGELKFFPRLVIVTERMRQHLNIKSDYGSGPNPEQSFIISLDKSRIYEGESYLKYLELTAQGVRYLRKPPQQASFLEIELEFERNVSDVLDRRIKAAEENGSLEELSRLTAVRDAFLKDQQTIMDVIDEGIQDQGLDLVPAQKSKYVQAYEKLYGAP